MRRSCGKKGIYCERLMPHFAAPLKYYARMLDRKITPIYPRECEIVLYAMSVWLRLECLLLFCWCHKRRTRRRNVPSVGASLLASTVSLVETCFRKNPCFTRTRSNRVHGI